MIFLTNSSSPPSAMISVTPPVFTELGGGRREFLELTPCREQRRRRINKPILSAPAAQTGAAALGERLRRLFLKGNIRARGEADGLRLTFASSWLAKNGGLHMQKSYTISVSSFRASISNVF